MCSKFRKIVQLSGVKRAIIRCFYIAKNDLVSVTQKSVQLPGKCVIRRAIIRRLLYLVFFFLLFGPNSHMEAEIILNKHKNLKKYLYNEECTKLIPGMKI